MRAFFLSVALFSLVLPFASPRADADRRAGAQPSSARDQAVALQNESVGGPFHGLCSSSGASGTNVMANCDSTVLPHNETAIIVDPNDPGHLVAGSNDTELIGPSAKSAMGYYTSFDGGRSWLNGQVPNGGFSQTSDASVGLDTLGNVYYGMVAFDLGLGGQALGGAIQVARSTDGGGTFGTPGEVERSTSAQIEEDKPYLGDKHQRRRVRGPLHRRRQPLVQACAGQLRSRGPVLPLGGGGPRRHLQRLLHGPQL